MKDSGKVFATMIVVGGLVAISYSHAPPILLFFAGIAVFFLLCNVWER